MAEETRVIPNETENLKAVRKDWGRITNCKPVFRSDGKSFLLAADRTVKVVSTETGVVLKEYIHNDVVVGIAERNEQYVAFTSEGVVTVWDSKKDECIESYKLFEGTSYKNHTVLACHVTRNMKQVFFLHKASEGSKATISSFNLKTQNKEKRNIKEVQAGQGKFAVSHNDEYVAHLTNDALIITGNQHKHFTKHISGTRVFTCVVWHPLEERLATGDDSGRVILWYNVLESRPVKSILHWHTLPVQDLAFSSLGNHLYSGGGESVLVKWLLTEDERGKVFLPRLGMPIVSVTTDPTNEFILAGMSDNGYTIISSRMLKVNGVLQNMSIGLDCENPYRAGIAYDARTGGVVLNAAFGHLQVFDVDSCKQLFQMDVLLSNYITQERKKKIVNTEIAHTALSADGKWLATVEVRNDKEASFEMRLKFWQFIDTDQSWSLNTNIEMPHDKLVNNIIFEPTNRPDSELICLTCADDGKFKIWEMAEKPHGGGNFWACHRIGFYRHLPAVAVNMSPDASLIAAGFDSILTFWLPESCHLKGTLSQPYLRERIRQVEFGRGEGSASFIITRTDNWICSWDFFSCSLAWRVGIQSTCLAADPLSSYMAIFSEDHNVFIFEPQSSVPVCWQKGINKARVLDAAFIPRQEKKTSGLEWNMQSTLLFLDEHQMIQTVEEGSTFQEEVSKRVRQFEQETLAQPAPTPFNALIAKMQLSHAGSESKSHKGTAMHGVNVERSTMFIQEIMNNSRVYRLESFADMVVEFSNLLIPEAVTSEEKREQLLREEQLKESEALRTKKKILKKQKKKDIERVTGSDFSHLVELLE